VVNDEVPPTTKDCLTLVKLIDKVGAVFSAKTAAFAVVPVII
jgi:hypothetical protein